MTNFLTLRSVSHAVQGIIVGGMLAFLMAEVMMNAAVRAMTTTVNGWSITMKADQPGNHLNHLEHLLVARANGKGRSV